MPSMPRSAALPSIRVLLFFAILTLAPQALRAASQGTFRRGDVNGSGGVDIGDAISLIECLFLAGKCPSCPDAADVNDDGSVNLGDVVGTLFWLFSGGPPPAEPGPHHCGLDPTRDELGACVTLRSSCPDVEEEDPSTADLISRLHYASVAFPDEEVELPDVSPQRSTRKPVRRPKPYEPRPGESFAWNSVAGRRTLAVVAGNFEPDLEGARTHLPGSLEHTILTTVDGPSCVEPEFYVEASDRVFGGWPEVAFQAPKNAFGTEAAARQFLKKVHAEQPFYLPFLHADVRLGHGWYYSNGGGLHRACDYSRTGVEEDEDSTFLVRSAGAGRVVAVTWDHNAGNTVAVESTAPDGQKVMFLYLHLRNGRSNDIANAKSSTSSSDKYVKYRAFARDYPDHLSWGEEDHTIQVSVGDVIGAQAIIGYAGNTGAGGAGSGLNDDGSPKNWKGNVHLHVYVAVPHPTDADTWVWVDPYGVYERVDTGCYDYLKDTQFSRLYAPFYPTFHGVPYEVFDYYFMYYVNMGWSLRTVSVHRQGTRLLVSGSFEPGIPGKWYAHGYMTPDQFQDKFDVYGAAGYVPQETVVTKTLGGSPRYTAIWRPLEPGEDAIHYAALSDAQWNDAWEDIVGDMEWRLADYFAYTSGGQRRHSVLLTSHQGRPFLFSGLKTSVELDALIDDYSAAGYYPVSFNAAELSGGFRVSGIFRNRPGCWKVYWGRTPTEYQALVSQKLAEGYRVWKVQGYADSGRYGVVLHKPAGPCS